MSGTPHLDLEQLLGAVGSSGPGEAERAHLDACPECQAELDSWTVVAGGVRSLVAATAPVARHPDGVASFDTFPAYLWDPSNVPPGGRLRDLLASRPRRVFLGAAAVVALMIGGTWFGLAAGLPRGNPGPAPGVRPAGTPGLMAVNGCSDLTASTGVLERVNGNSLVLETPGGQSVTVTTSPSTRISREVTGSLSDVSDGAHVFVGGPEVNGEIIARNILVGTAGQVKLPDAPVPPGLPGFPKRAGLGPPSLGLGLNSGTVSGAYVNGFTLMLSDGTHVPVRTASSTTVVTMATARLGQLETGEFTVAVGNPGPNGTLAATTVEQESLGPAGLPRVPLPGGSPLPGPKPALGGGFSRLPDLGCSPATIATVALVTLG